MSTRPNFAALLADGAPRYGWVVTQQSHPNYLPSLQTFTRGSASVEVEYYRNARLKRVTFRDGDETLVIDQTVGAMKEVIISAIFKA